MKVLVACECSGTVRDAYRRRGYDAWSCDLEPVFQPSLDFDGFEYDQFHLTMDALDALELDDWDLMIAHPPCTHLAVSGARWFIEKKREQAEALDFVRKLMSADIPRIAIENPISIISSEVRKPDQIIQPWMFGHGETKATCLWLKNLPNLEPTRVVEGRGDRIHMLPPGPNRAEKRSRTYPGIAEAMAEQWVI